MRVVADDLIYHDEYNHKNFFLKYRMANRDEEKWEMSQAELAQLIKEEQEWFDWDVDQRFNDLYAQVLHRDMSDVNCAQDVYHNMPRSIDHLPVLTRT